MQKKKKDRFKNYEEDVKHLVLDFESMEESGGSRYFDLDEMEIIIDFYLDNSDGDMIEKSVRYGEYLFPSSNEIRLRRAHLLCFKERYNDAYKMLKQLEQVQPDNTEVQYALGAVLSALDQPRKAIQYYQKASADGHELGIIYGNIADEYVKMDRRAEARNYYRKALALKPDDEHSLYELANCYEDDNLIDKWIEYYQRFVGEHPYSKVAWFCLGEGYAAASLFEKAIDAYQYAITIDPEFFYAYSQTSLCYLTLGDYSKAVEALHEAYEHTEDKAQVSFRIGDIYRMQNNQETAIYYFRRALKEDPFYAEAWHAMSTCHTATFSFESAIDCAQRALNIEPDNPIYLTTLALIYADSGDYENADLVFEKTIPLFSDFEQGWIAFADYQIVRGNFEAAIEGLTKGLPTCELVMEFNKRLALCYYMTGRRNMLFNAVRACIFDNPDGAKELLEYLPELEKDPEVMNIIASHINHNDYSI